MSERVFIRYADFNGNTYTYSMPEAESKTWCRHAGVPRFDEKAFSAWYENWSPNTSFAKYDSGRINTRSVAQIWFEVQGVN